MSWKPGDLARCVDVGDIRLPLRMQVHRGGKFLRAGMVYIVRDVVDAYGSELCLDVAADHGPKLARRFVKVPPVDEMAGEAAVVRI